MILCIIIDASWAYQYQVEKYGDLETAASDHGHHHESGGGHKFHEDHHDEHGEKGEKDYHKHHHHGKGDLFYL